MHVIHTAEHLAHFIADPLDTGIARLLQDQAERLAGYGDFDLSELASFAIIQAGDTVEAVEAGLNLTILDSSGTFSRPPEGVVRQGGWYEITFIISDDGFGLVLYIPINTCTEPRLLAASQQAFAETAIDPEA